VSYFTVETCTVVPCFDCGDFRYWWCIDLIGAPRPVSLCVVFVRCSGSGFASWARFLYLRTDALQLHYLRLSFLLARRSPPLPFPSAIRTNFPHCLEVAMQTLRNVCSCLNHCDVAFSSLQAGLHLQSTFTSLGYVSEAGVHRFIYDCVPLSCLARKPLCGRKKQLKSFVIFATRNCGAKSKMRNLHSLNFQDFRLFSWLPGCRIRSRNVVLPGFFELLGDFYNGTLCCSPRVLIHTMTWPFCDIFCGINSDCAEVMRVTTRHAASAVDPCQGWAKSRVLLLKM